LNEVAEWHGGTMPHGSLTARQIE